MAGEATGPLHGVPVTVKDSFDMAGLATLCGSKFRLGHRAAADATAVARMRAAGAIVLGKTNCPEFLSNYESDNYITGRTNNPWNLGPDFGRIERRRIGRDCGVFLRGRHWQRWRRLGPHSGALLRHRRPQADAGPRLRRRPLSRDRPSRRPAGRGRPHGPHGE